jgi:(5-formylfuran-3-yl)methyl phosphate synthase
MMSRPEVIAIACAPVPGRSDLRRKESTLLLLISPDSVEEALECAKAAEHLDIVDVKKPDEGSLGANFPWVIRAIREAVPADKPVSATVGDVPYKPGTVAQAALGAVVSGATYIKVGLYGCTSPEQAIEVMRGVVRAVKDYRPDAFVVASGYADAHRIGCVNPLALPDIARRSGSDAAMLDTAIKDGTGLFDHLTPELCAQFVRLAHEAGLLAALAGSVKAADLETLTGIGTDIVGVRGAVCTGGDRNTGRIQPGLVAAFRAEMDRHARELGYGVAVAAAS